jgi:hypothetical protein
LASDDNQALYEFRLADSVSAALGVEEGPVLLSVIYAMFRLLLALVVFR